MIDRSEYNGYANIPIWKLIPIAVGAIIWLLVIILVTDTISGLVPGSIPQILQYSLIGLIISIFGLTIYSRLVMRRPLSWFALDDPNYSTARWTLIGIVFAIVVAMATVFSRGGKIVSTVTDPETILISIVGSILAGLFAAILEEFIFRGMLYQLLENRWNAAVAILAPAIIFGVLHTGRADSQVELWLVVIRTIVGGALFGIIVYRTQNIWNAIAVHASWNFILGAQIVDVAVSGESPGSAIINIVLTETGLFGTDVGLTNTVATITILLVACILLLSNIGVKIQREIISS